jgi:GT2 family glycosyltransferase
LIFLSGCARLYSARVFIKTLNSLITTGVCHNYQVIVVDNASTCTITKDFLKELEYNQAIKLITNSVNVGTAKAINQAWSFRHDKQHCIKIDNDIVINSNNDWVQELIEVVERDNKIGQIGLKRKDLWENTQHKYLFYLQQFFQIVQLGNHACVDIA